MNLIKSPSSLVAWKIYTGPVGKLPCQGLENLCFRPVSVSDLLRSMASHFLRVLVSLDICICVLYMHIKYIHI